MKPRFFSSARRMPDEVSGVRIPFGPSNRRTSRWSWRLAVGALLSPLAYLGAIGAYARVAVVAPGTVVARQQEIRATRAGFLEQISVGVGDRVAAGQQVVTLSDPLLDERQHQLEAELAELVQAAAEGTDLGTALAAQVRVRQAVLGERIRRQHTVRMLFERGAATAAEVDRAREQRLQAEDALTSARAALAAHDRRGGSGDADGGTMGRIRSELDLIGFQRQALSLTAAHAGRVTSVDVREGEFVNQATPLLVIGALDQAVIVAYLEPRFARRVHPGLRATVRFPDGTTIAAGVTNEPSVSKRLPPQLGTAFGTRHMSVLSTLSPEGAWPERYQIDGLPVSVRFHYPWEHAWWGRAFAGVLGWLQPRGV